MSDRLIAVVFIVLAVPALILPEISLDKKISNHKIVFSLKFILFILPPLLAILTIVFNLVSYSSSIKAVNPLFGPILFVLFAVPLSMLLDQLGFFRLIAASITGRKHSLFILWILAAAVTATLNLDTAIVLLTPIYVNIARTRSLPLFAIAVQPALLSGIASLFLPISNVTNLIMTSKFNLSASDFLRHLGIAGLIAIGVGFVFYLISDRRYTKINGKPIDGRVIAIQKGFSKSQDQKHGEDAPEDAPGKILRQQIAFPLGIAICLFSAAGFTLIPLIGGQPWEVALAADIILMLAVRSIPWRAIPLRIALNVVSLGVLAESLERYVDFRNLLTHTSALGTLQAGVLTGIFSNLANNLPVTLGITSALGKGQISSVWPVLIGTNIGSLLLPSGSLAIMLWLATLKRLDTNISGITYIKYAWRVVIPTFVISLTGLALLRA